MATLELQTDLTLEDRKAVLMAVPCPGKTHAMIKNPTLRAEFARELNDWRNQRHQGRREGIGELSQEEWLMWRAGLESGFWAMQKAENRAFLYEGQRASWQLGALQANDEAYQRYEAAVVELHRKVKQALNEIQHDFQEGRLDGVQRARYRRSIMDKQETRLQELRREYNI